MVFLLTSIDQQGQTRDFSCQLPDLEDGFDLLRIIKLTLFYDQYINSYYIVFDFYFF